MAAERTGTAAHRRDDADLSRPAVAPEVYDHAYFTGLCAGSEPWVLSGGAQRDPRYDGSLAIIGLRPGETLLDLGTGRGELLAAAVQAGAPRAVGVEYAPAAVALARQTLAAAGVADRAEVHQADLRRLPLPDGVFDVVTMLDVIEHLTEDEQRTALAEARRVLRPGGRILVHTFPTRTLYDVTYRLHRAIGRHSRWPVDPRHDFEHTMHVGEQTLLGLRRRLRGAGFARVKVRPGLWMYTDFVPDERARALYYRLARVPLLRRLAVADLWADAVRPTS
jgi:SAM-dependent methyltransferase